MGGMCGQADDEREFEEKLINPGTTNITAKEGDRIMTRGSREILDRQKNPIFPDSALRNRAVDAQNENKQTPLSIGQQLLKDNPKTFPGDRQSATLGRNYNDQMNPAMELFNRQSGGVDPLARLYRGGIEDAPSPREQGFVDSYNHPLSKYVEPFTDFMGKMQGYDMDTEQGRYEFWKAGQLADEAYQRGQEQRKLDDDRAMRTNLQTATPLDPCPEGFRFDEATQQCVAIEGEKEVSIYERNPQTMGEFLGGAPITSYGKTGIPQGGEYTWFKKDGGAIRAPQGEIRGQGGPKDDLVGPVMLSNTEYVLPNEQVKMYGGGNYATGLRRLEKDRKNALKNYG